MTSLLGIGIGLLAYIIIMATIIRIASNIAYNMNKTTEFGMFCIFFWPLTIVFSLVAAALVLISDAFILIVDGVIIRPFYYIGRNLSLTHYEWKK